MIATTYEDLIGLTFKFVEVRSKYDDWDKEELRFTSECGRFFRFYHWQECCESVYIEDIVGDLSDLEGSPLLLAEEVTNQEDNEFGRETRTYYKFATRKGCVDVRWYGTSNGYYSESVDFEEITKED